MVKFSVYLISKRTRENIGKEEEFCTRMCAGGSEICTAAYPFHGLKGDGEKEHVLSRMRPRLRAIR